MEEQVHAPTVDEEAVIKEQVYFLGDDDNLEDIDCLLEDL